MQFIILLVLFSIHGSDLLKTFPVKTFAKSYFKKNSRKKNAEFHMAGNNDTREHPGDKSDLIRKINNEWEEYYKCLLDKKKYYDIKQVKPIIRQLLEGQYTELGCFICKKPSQDFERLKWKYKPFDENVTEFDHFDLPQQMFLTDEKILQMYNVQISYSGVYACFQGNTTTAVYLIEISNDQNIINVTEEKTYLEKKQIPGTQLLVYVEWSEWTECSTCKTIGKAFKYGICMVMTKTDNFNLEDANNNKNLETELEIIGRFQTGIPCNSSFLPKSLQKYDQISHQPAQVAVQFCKIPCPPAIIFEVVDAHGKVLETANNSAGIFSAFQNLPPLPADAERRTVTAEFGGNIIMPCPGNQLTNTPYTWKVKNLTIIPELIAMQSQGRITIDLLNRVSIRRIRKKDSKTYSCWQGDKLAGTIHLEVKKKLKIRLDHHVILISLILLIVTVILLGLKILARQMKK